MPSGVEHFEQFKSVAAVRFFSPLRCLRALSTVRDHGRFRDDDLLAAPMPSGVEHRRAGMFFVHTLDLAALYANPLSSS